jgi:hypothetical protein
MTIVRMMIDRRPRSKSGQQGMLTMTTNMEVLNSTDFKILKIFLKIISYTMIMMKKRMNCWN